MNLNPENTDFFIVIEFVDRKVGFVKLVYITRAEADKLKRKYFNLFEWYSLGSTLPFSKKLIESFTQYDCKFHEYLDFGPESSKILCQRTSRSNGDLTVNIVERLVKMSIPEFIAWRNLPFYFGFSLH